MGAPTTEAPTTEGSDLYTFGEKGIRDGCPLGYSGILEEAACQHAADDLGYKMLTGAHHHNTAYPGCYFYEPLKRAYFNTHPSPDGTWHTENAGVNLNAGGTNTRGAYDAGTTNIGGACNGEQCLALSCLTAPQQQGAYNGAPTTEPPLYILGKKGMVDGRPLGCAGIFVEPVCEEAADELGLNMRAGASNLNSAYPVA